MNDLLKSSRHCCSFLRCGQACRAPGRVPHVPGGWSLVVVAMVLAAFATACFTVDHTPAPELTTEVEDWRDEIIYQILVDRFSNGDPSTDHNVNTASLTAWHGGDWQGIIDRLDYLEELGVTTLWISPPFTVVEEDAGIAGYHGYWPQNFVRANPHFGDLATLRRLVEEAHDRDMKVILDVIVNHIGQLFYYDINLNGQPDEHVEGSGLVYDEYGGLRSEVIRTTEWDPDYDPRGIQARTSLGEAGDAPIIWVDKPELNRMPPKPKAFQNPEWYHRRGRVVTPWGWEIREMVETADFPGGLKAIDTTRQDVRDEMVDIWAWWIEETNADGFRIDTVKHVEKDFWSEFAPRIRERLSEQGKENFLMFGEIFDGNDAVIGRYTAPDKLDSTFYFSHKYQVFDDVFGRGGPTQNIENLYNQRPDHYGTSAQPGGITDADGNGIAPTEALVNFIDNHDVARFLFYFPEEDRLRAALFYLLTMDGIPCIYYGTEQDFDGGNDPANRENMWLNDGFDTSGETFRHTRRLIELRKELAPLRRGDFQIRWVTPRTGDEQDAGIVAFERTYQGETVLVVVNANAEHTSETSATEMGGGAMDVSFSPNTQLVDLFDDGEPTYTVDGNGQVTVDVPPLGGRILVER